VTDVSIVLLNWNSSATVIEAAESASDQTGVRVQLLIVDNGSTDGSLETLKRQFPHAQFIEIGFNSGFANGMNAGSTVAAGEFILWQNADLVLAPDYCALALQTMRADDTIGAMGGLVHRLVNGHRTNVFDASGYTINALHRAVAVSNRTVAQDVVGVSGSCPILRRRALEDIRRPVGYALDPWYFTYGEDIDVMLRLHLAGWRVRYDPAMLAWHVRSGSTVVGSRFYERPDVTQVHHFKNRVATIAKTYPVPVLLRRLPLLVMTELVVPPYLLLKGKPRGIWNWLRSWGQFLKESPRLLRDRKTIFARADHENQARTQALLR
jgi:GT2 family glycosyltransferase